MIQKHYYNRNKIEIEILQFVSFISYFNMNQ